MHAIVSARWIFLVSTLKNFINIIQRHIICYADDTVIISSGKDCNEVKKLTESNIQKIHKWLNYNMLTLNINNTKYLIFSRTILNQPLDFIIKLHHSPCNTQNCSCSVLKNGDSFKYLGVIVEQHHRWSSHTWRDV